MGEKNLWSKLGLIVILVGMCAWQIHPYEQRLKPGIDLGGGHSLLFEIDDSDLQEWARRDLAQRVMKVLKDRVDPQGTRNLVWRPIGRNRLEIQMPMPPPEGRRNRQEYESARDALTANNITEAQIRTALGRPPAQREAAFAVLVGKVSARREMLTKLAEVDEKYRLLRAEQDRRLPSTGPAATAAAPPASAPAATQPAATQDYKELDRLLEQRRTGMENLLKSNIDVNVLSDLLALDPRDAQRIKGLQKIEQEHPDLVELIRKVHKSYDDYARSKGVLDDPSDLMRLLRGAGVLEFRILAVHNPGDTSMIDSSNPKYNEPIARYTEQLAKRGPRPQPGDSFQWFKIAKQDNEGFRGYIVQEYMGAKYVLAHATPDMGLLNDRTWTLQSAREGYDSLGRISVNFSLDVRGGKQFGAMTGNNLKRPLCIFLDGEAISAATIQDRISSNGQITGSFTQDYVQYLVNTLEAGALPARLKEVPLQEKGIGPALGATNRAKGQKAVVLAFAATVVFMFAYYAYCGFIADIALLMNLVITLGVMSFLQATFTLPGIAGLILTLGMAVDANVLIFERMREELQRGVSVRMAVKLGYEKAFSAILDSNVTTIITAIILGALGSEEIKGFGLTLGIGLCISMFTALFVTRQYFHVMLPNTLNAEENRRVWLSTGILALLCGTFMGLGYLFHTAPAERATSTTWHFGIFLLWLFGTAVVMLASLRAFRFIYGVSGHRQNNRMPMLKLLSAPNINWMAKYKKFWLLSAVVITAGFIFMADVNKSDFLDIEFIGGTTVQVQLKDAVKGDFKVNADELLLDKYIAGKDPNTKDPANSVGWLRVAADAVQNAAVSVLDEERVEIKPAMKLTLAQMRALLLPRFEDLLVRGGITDVENGAQMRFDPGKFKEGVRDVEAVKRLLAEAADYVRSAANKMRSARVQLIQEEGSGAHPMTFEVITTETNRVLVAEALLAAMNEILEVVRPLDATLVKDPDLAPDGIFPIKMEDDKLADVIGGNVQESVAEFKGGLALVFDQLDPPQTLGALEQRLKEMRFQPDFEGLAWRVPRLLGLEPVGNAPAGGQPLYKKIAVLVKDAQLLYVDGEDNSTWKSQVADRELILAQAALASTRSLQRVMQFAPQVAAETTQKAIIAIILSLIAIAAYVWIRFGSVDFGLAGIIALYHDVAVALAALMACHYCHDTALGKFFMLRDFKIDLNVVAALLTIVGFSINDTIVIFDRIRELRGRLATVSPSLINLALNQTLSRTLITTFTVLATVTVMYVYGGDGIHGFSFTLLIGCLSGTYSTLAIATPMLHHPRAMWITTIILSSLTALVVINTLPGESPFNVIKVVFFAIVSLVALFALFKQIVALLQARPHRQPTPA